MRALNKLLRLPFNSIRQFGAYHFKESAFLYSDKIDKIFGTADLDRIAINKRGNVTSVSRKVYR